jgi:hypothetical protein
MTFTLDLPPDIETLLVFSSLADFVAEQNQKVLMFISFWMIFSQAAIFMWV